MWISQKSPHCHFDPIFSCNNALLRRRKVHPVSADQTPAPKNGPSRKSTRLKWRLIFSVEQTPHCNSLWDFKACVGYTSGLHDGKPGSKSHGFARHMISVGDLLSTHNYNDFEPWTMNFSRLRLWDWLLPSPFASELYTTAFVSYFSDLPTSSHSPLENLATTYFLYSSQHMSNLVPFPIYDWKPSAPCTLYDTCFFLFCFSVFIPLFFPFPSKNLEL